LISVVTLEYVNSNVDNSFWY